VGKLLELMVVKASDDVNAGDVANVDVTHTTNVVDHVEDDVVE